MIRSATQPLIIDTSVWIDLFDGDLIHAVFDLPDEFAMTDLAFNELVDPNRRNQLRSAGLQIVTLSGVQILELMYLIEQHPKVSRADISGFLAARDKSSIFLTGDKSLRKLAERNRVEVHGTIWLMEQMLRNQTVTSSQIENACERMRFEGSRMPWDECERLYRKNTEGSSG